MEPIILKEYTCESRFILYDAGAYTPLCSDVVLYRAMGGMFTGPSIDLIFLGIHYFEMPNELKGVHVSRPRDEQALEFAKVYAPQYEEELGERVYVVESNGRKFHVIAENFWVHVHTEPLSRSSLVPLCEDDLARRDAYIGRYVEEWYKVE